MSDRDAFHHRLLVDGREELGRVVVDVDDAYQHVGAVTPARRPGVLRADRESVRRHAVVVERFPQRDLPAETVDGEYGVRVSAADAVAHHGVASGVGIDRLHGGDDGTPRRTDVLADVDGVRGARELRSVVVLVEHRDGDQRGGRVASADQRRVDRPHRQPVRRVALAIETRPRRDAAASRVDPERPVRARPVHDAVLDLGVRAAVRVVRAHGDDRRPDADALRHRLRVGRRLEARRVVVDVVHGDRHAGYSAQLRRAAVGGDYLKVVLGHALAIQFHGRRQLAGSRVDSEHALTATVASG